MRGKWIEIIAFEIEEDNSVAEIKSDESFDKDASQKWHSVEESEAMVLEAVQKHYANRN